jgi:hypothetical protein
MKSLGESLGTLVTMQVPVKTVRIGRVYMASLKTGGDFVGVCV